jgi:membrane-associated phospholipid phosphatase
MNKFNFRVFLILTFLFFSISVQAEIGNTSKSSILSASTNFHINYNFRYHTDSIHRLNFRYPDKKRGLKPYYAPALLITAGTTIHLFPATKENFREFAQENFPYNGRIDDYIQYAPLIAVYGLNSLGIKGKNNFGNRTALGIKSFFLMDFVVNNLKNWTKTERPNGSLRSFPSGHTALTFSMAHFMHKEYGEISPWYSVAAYSCAATVGIMRVAKDAHWISDVFAGAGIGMLSTELVYLTHLYKWDKAHVKNLDIFPFQTGKQKGIAMVYRF